MSFPDDAPEELRERAALCVPRADDGFGGRIEVVPEGMALIPYYCLKDVSSCDILVKCWYHT